MYKETEVNSDLCCTDKIESKVKYSVQTATFIYFYSQNYFYSVQKSSNF